MKKISMFLAVMGIIAVIVTACGGSSSTYGTTGNATSSEQAANENSPSTTASATITIANMAFGEPLTLSPGAQIAVVNNDSVEHSVTSDTAGAFDVEVDGNEKKTLTAPSQPGDYPFHCKYHPNMKGTLTVK